MKKSLQCPKCEGRKIAHVSRVMDTMGPLSLARRRGVLGNRPAAGALEAFVCAACGYAELYSSDMEALLRGDGVRIVDNEPKATLR
jgi:predicted nucleic-acid-binding Zn-ribbon protein